MSNKSETAHTPAPWVYENGHGVIACGNPLRVAGRTKVAKANRALVAAAPDLLAALQAHDAYMVEQGYGDPDAGHVHPKAAENLRRVRAAIAKATTQ